MTTSRTRMTLDKLNDEVIPDALIGYFEERNRNKLYHLVVSKFEERKKEDPRFTQRALARRIGKKPSQVSRWLSSPGNWTNDTAALLLLGIGAFEIEHLAIPIVAKQTTTVELKRVATLNVQLSSYVGSSRSITILEGGKANQGHIPYNVVAVRENVRH